MTEPTLKKYPAEIFGYPYSVINTEVNKNRAEQHCPFLNDVCKKPRKSEPHIKVGICSVGYKGNHSDKHVPVIICPHRFEISVVKKTIKENYFPDANENDILWVPEVHLNQTAGFFDYVAALVDRTNEPAKVIDFVCVELQAAGTTGTPWDAFQEHKKNGKFSKDTYNFGINWANEFAKTMMQQAYKKGLIVSRWKKKLVFVIQDIGLRYLEQNYDVSGLHEPKETDYIDFCTLDMVWNDNNNAWELKFARLVSTNEDGVRKMLGGVNEEDYPTVQQLIKRISEKSGGHHVTPPSDT